MMLRCSDVLILWNYELCFVQTVLSSMLNKRNKRFLKMEFKILKLYKKINIENNKLRKKVLQR